MPFPYRKLFASPLKALFYAYFYAAYFLRRVMGSRQIVMMGIGHTRPNLTWKVFRLLGLKEVRGGNGAAYYHENDTAVEGAAGAINGKCVDVGKALIGKVFAQVAGYNLDIDPRIHRGPMVRKSNVNALHDGVILQGPISDPDPGYVYQLLIDNRDGERVLDIRPVIVGAEIPVVYLKWRPVSDRFSNDNAKVVAADADEVLSKEEQTVILAMAQRLGLDVGELDVLRDNSNGKIYVVDAAKTPHSPGDAYLGIGGIVAMHRVARSFSRQFL